ncbi:SHOCT domain-containing protein [Alkalibacillus aidingensis]|uniref:SHOCT domain-containing protein n=1 Tax=Alkalibacillus aidingensis TaxID=2747607 RepID=UPI001661070B|nr:SHOCT domain-containing protein [Alkalibacillus aidingensis]
MHFMNGFWPPLLMVIFWGALLILGFLLISNYLDESKRNDPYKILKERLAKGEITEEEYERIKSTLKD